MRYSDFENPTAVGILPTGLGPVGVEILCIETGTLLALSDDRAQESAVMPGVWQFPFTNIVDPILGFTQVVVKFTLLSTGDVDYSKLVLKGYVDDVRKTKILVATTI